jgi:hypothetical protein
LPNKWTFEAALLLAPKALMADPMVLSGGSHWRQMGLEIIGKQQFR